jgi:4-hydroxyacetophenone monooxygenase
VAGYSDPISEGAQRLLAHLPFTCNGTVNMFWRYGDGLLPFLRKDPDCRTPTAVNKGNDRHREELIYLSCPTEGSSDLVGACRPIRPMASASCSTTTGSRR